MQEESSEYETDSEEEGYGRRLLKPVFVPKESRDVSQSREHGQQVQVISMSVSSLQMSMVTTGCAAKAVVPAAQATSAMQVVAVAQQ
jgi:hypothetical protein